MNKHFFKIENKIQLSDILKILGISNSKLFKVNPNFGKNILEIYIDDFVSFSNLKQNKLSFFVDKIKVNIEISSGICLVEDNNIEILGKNIIKVPFHNPRLGFSMILNNYFSLFNSENNDSQIHSTSIVHSTAKLGKNVTVGPYSIISEGVIIGDNTIIGDRVSISFNCSIGSNVFIAAGVFIECSIIDDNVNVLHNSVIGKPGFGFVPNKSETTLIPHIGAVYIGKGTNIGSCCTIDRGLLDNTIIGKSVMIDNQVHVAHNCIIGDYCILAGQVGLSGSVCLEENVIIGGDVSIKDNITIGKNSLIAGASKVFNNFPKDSKIGGSPAQDIIDWKRIVAAQRLTIKKRKKN